jgi:hypothetical protein
MLVLNIDPDNETAFCPKCLTVSNLIEPLKYEEDEEPNLFAECKSHGVFIICPECLDESIDGIYKSNTIDINKLYCNKDGEENDPDDYNLNHLPEKFISYNDTFFTRDQTKQWIGALGTCSLCSKPFYGYISNE